MLLFFLSPLEVRVVMIDSIKISVFQLHQGCRLYLPVPRRQRVRMRTFCSIFLEGDTPVEEGMRVWKSSLVLMLGRRRKKSTDRQISRVTILRTTRGQKNANNIQVCLFFFVFFVFLSSGGRGQGI